mmetsp:Transcript_19804/g.55047  ORF Transcript_19804/g.55047 Transcript_19804/m.55047 type:complete len:206 (+) Transcript_19804:885-1502(+)
MAAPTMILLGVCACHTGSGIAASPDLQVALLLLRAPIAPRDDDLLGWSSESQSSAVHRHATHSKCPSLAAAPAASSSSLVCTEGPRHRSMPSWSRLGRPTGPRSPPLPGHPVPHAVHCQQPRTDHAALGSLPLLCQSKSSLSEQSVWRPCRATLLPSWGHGSGSCGGPRPASRPPQASGIFLQRCMPCPSQTHNSSQGSRLPGGQ